MAETTSIASRMEKLAKLKRMKESMAAQPSVAQTASAPEEVLAAPATEAFETIETPEPAFPAEPELSMPEDHSPAETLSESFAEVMPEMAEGDMPVDPADIMQMPQEDSDESFDFDPADIRAEDLAAETMPSDHAMLDDETDAVSESSAPETDPDFARDDIDGIAAMADMGEAAAESSAANVDEEFAKSIGESELPDFSANEVEEELLNREFEDEAVAEQRSETPEMVENDGAPVAEETAEGRITVSFDKSRSTLLDHVSRQMNCSVEDVVVTALDWYLDALFGEDGEAKSA